MPFFKSFLASATIALIVLAFVRDYRLFLLVFVITRIGFSAANIFYDSMLVDVSPKENRDLVSSYGFAWGYIGSCIPFIISILLIAFAETLGLKDHQAMVISFFITAIWWIGFSIPLIKNYRQDQATNTGSKLSKEVSNTFSQLLATIKEISGHRQIALFLIAYFFYIDGVSTIINMATAYGTSLGLSAIGLIFALLMTQFVAFPATIFIGRVSHKIGHERLLNICILGYTAIGILAIFLNSLWQFWVLAFMVGLFQGGIQSLSRSHFSKIIPQHKSGAYFGIYDIFGKGAAIFGTFSMSLISQLTGRQSLGILLIVFFFIIGLVLYNYSLAQGQENK